MLKELIEKSHSPLADKWITSKKLRQELGISARTEQNWLKAGLLKKYKIQGKLFYLWDEINDLLLMKGEE